MFERVGANRRLRVRSRGSEIELRVNEAQYKWNRILDDAMRCEVNHFSLSVDEIDEMSLNQ